MCSANVEELDVCVCVCGCTCLFLYYAYVCKQRFHVKAASDVMKVYSCTEPVFTFSQVT